jgi:hypothetical protein
VSRIFDPIRPQLKKQKVPVKLPTYIPVLGKQFGNAANQPIYATISGQTKPGYSIVLGYSQGCSGGNACRYGTVTGQPKPRQSIEKTYAFIRDPQFKGRKSPEAMAPVRLASGLQGWFIPWTCGVNCADAEVVWDQGAYRYLVSVKQGDKASLVQMANSAIGAR